MPNIYDQGDTNIADQSTLPAGSTVLDPPQTSGLFGNTSVIWDTDFSGDADDLGAGAVLHSIAELFGTEILGMIYTANCFRGPSVLDALNLWRQQGKEAVNIQPMGFTGNDLGECGGTVPGDYVNPIFQDPNTYPRHIRVGNLPTGATKYRQLLSNADDNSVTIVITGWPTSFANLLTSSGDGIDSRNGVTLVKDKVKVVYQMGGRDADTNNPQTENNVSVRPGDTQTMINKCPVPLVFNPFEIGINTTTPTTGNSRPSDHIVAFGYSGTNQLGGKASFDQATMIQALLGSLGFFSIKRGEVSLDSNNKLIFTQDSEGDDWYTDFVGTYSNLESLIDILMWGDLETQADLETALSNNGVNTTPSVATPADVAYTLEVIVNDGGGNPIQGATVTWEESDTATQLDQRTTDANGRVVLRTRYADADLSQGTDITASANNFSAQTKQQSIGTTTLLYEQTFSLSAASTGVSIAFTGSNAVTDQNDNPVDGATVYAVNLASSTVASATTDANGEATISGLDAGTDYRTWAEKDTDSDGDLETTQVIIRAAS